MNFQKIVINELKPGKSWLVCWEVQGELHQTNANTLTTNTTFTCGETIYKVGFNLLCNTSNLWYSQIDFESMKGNNSSNNHRFIVKNSISSDDKSSSIITVFHQGIKQEGILEKELRLSWPLRKVSSSNTTYKSADKVFAEEYSRNEHSITTGYRNVTYSICNFQIIIEIPDDDYEKKGLLAIQNNLFELLEKESLADIQFVFKDDKVPAHSIVIAASSPVFAAIFEGGRFQEGQTRTVNIEDIDSRVFRKLLRFLYTGSSGPSKQDPSDDLQALFLAADKYQVDALKEICEQFLICQLETETVLGHLEWAHLYGAEKLKEVAVTYIVKRRNEVWQLKECEDFNKKYPDVFFLVCKRMVN